MFTLSSIKIGMKYQNVRNEIIKSKNLIMRCLPATKRYFELREQRELFDDELKVCQIPSMICILDE